MVLVVTFCCGITAFAQNGDTTKNAASATVYKDTVEMEGFVQTSKSLNSNTVYIIRHNVKISSTATLTIPKNVKLLFDKGTTLVAEGGLNIAGEPNNFVELTSLNKNEQGVGILVRGKDGADISIKYARFTKLTTPINFELDWYRANVTIENDEFKELNTGETEVLLNTPFNKLYNVTDKKCTFSFSQNNFVNNWGSIYIENLQDNVMDLHFNNNLVTNDVVYGVDMGVPTNTPVFGYFDNSDKRYKAEMKGNSIFGNYQINAATDTIVREVSIGIQGEGEQFAVPNNFFRSPDPIYVSSTFDHFYQNNSLPLLTPEPMLQAPSAQVHAHIWKVNLAGSEVSNYSEIPEGINTKNVTFEVYFNRPVTAFGETQLESIFYDTINNGIKINPIAIKDGKFSADNKTYTFSVDDATFIENTLGYLVIKNFKDSDGFETPDFTIGQKKAINNYSKLFNSGSKSTYFSPAQMVNNPGGYVPDAKDLETLEDLSQLGDLSYLGAYTSLAKTWELGLMGGTMNYSGDLSARFMDKDAFRGSVGIYGQYNINKWFSARLGFLYGRISGTDINDPDLSRRKRAANFRSDIYDGSLTIHFHLLQYGISKGEKFSPSIFAGVSVFHFNPQARIFTGLDQATGKPTYLSYQDGVFSSKTDQEAGRQSFVWVPLNKIGTEGQTANSVDAEFPYREAPKKYSQWQIGIPFGLSFDYIINKSWTIGVEARFTFTFTDYLDDVSGYYFDRSNQGQAIVDANPTITGTYGLGKSVTLDPTVTVTNGTGEKIAIETARLLQNPSLVYAYSLDPNSGQRVYKPFNDDANSFPTARKGDSNRDWYHFFGIKASKIFGYNKNAKKQDKQKDDIQQQKY